MRTFALVFGLLAALLVVLLLRPVVSTPALASVRVFDARVPTRSVIDDRHEWTWVGAPAGTPEGPVLLRRDRASGAVVGRYAPASAKDASIGVEWSESTSTGFMMGPVRRERRLKMTTYARPIEERRAIF